MVVAVISFGLPRHSVAAPTRSALSHFKPVLEVEFVSNSSRRYCCHISIHAVSVRTTHNGVNGFPDLVKNFSTSGFTIRGLPHLRLIHAAPTEYQLRNVLPGERVGGRYEIRALLGRGAMAEVYRAVDGDTGRDVVLKLPHVAIAGDLAAFNRFRHEKEIVTGLKHPGVQRLVSDPSEPLMVFDYVEGQSLRTYLSANGPLPVDDVVRIGLQLAEALDYVHQQGVIHRDLKPENVLIGPDGHVTLTDFGIALRWAERGLSISHLSNAVGTPEYMAPEQVRGERGDARTDIYALGVLLYEMLTGVVPYPSTETGEAPSNPPLVRRLRPEAPAGLEAIVYRAMRRRPAERYASMSEMQADLSDLDHVNVPEQYLPDEPPPTPLGDLPPWSTTLRILLVVTVILLLAGVAAELVHRGLTSP